MLAATKYFLRAVFVSLALTILTMASPVHAQSDAETALIAARKAFEEQRFSDARDLLITASQTDANNPDIHLLLGKSHYQLGEIQQAMSAWRQTLRLAPQQVYAKRMLEVLSDNAVDLDTRLAVVANLLEVNVLEPLPAELATLRLAAKLTDAQRLQLLRLESEYHLRVGKPQLAARSLSELATRFPEQAESAPIRLLRARIQIAVGGPSLAEGLAELAALSQLEGEGDLAAAAQLAQIIFEVEQGKPALDALAKWINDHRPHPRHFVALQHLIAGIEKLLSIETVANTPQKDAELSDADRRILEIAATAFAHIETATDIDSLTTKVINHLELFYSRAGAFDATRAGLDTLQNVELTTLSSGLIAAAQRRLDSQIATAEFETITERLAESKVEPTALIAWIKKHPDHPQTSSARNSLLTFYLLASQKLQLPQVDTKLSTTDIAAINVAKEIFEATEKNAESLQLTDRLLGHVEHRYTANGALSAATSALELLLKTDLPTTSRVRVLHSLSTLQIRAAVERLNEAASEQRLVPGPLPDDLALVVQTFREIDTLTPAAPAWAQQAELANQVLAISAGLPWPQRPDSPKPTQTWAIEIALAVIADGGQASAVAAAMVTIDQIVTELATLKQTTADGLAVRTQERLLATLPKGKDAWVAATQRLIDLLTADSNQLFERHLSTKRPNENRQLNDSQKQSIEVLKSLIAARPSQASLALEKIGVAMSMNLASGHYGVVEEAYDAIRDSLPEKQQFETDLLVAGLWVRQIVERDNDRLKQGFAVAAELDPILVKAATSAYELQRGLADDDPRLTSARNLLDSIVQHYHRLEMFDVAEKAIAIKAKEPIAAADKWAEFKIASLKLALANRDLARLLTTFGGRDAMELTPEFAAAIESYQQFITKYTSDPLASTAVQELFHIATIFDGHQHGEIAAEIYQQIEKWAAEDKLLNQAKHHEASVAELAAFAKAEVLNRHATRLLHEQLVKQPEDAASPTKLSAEFTQAINAYQSLIANYPAGIYVRQSIDQILGIGLQYARASAWDVADKIYGDFLNQKLPLRQPERIEFAQAICQLGKVMPTHAQEILSELSQNKSAVPSETGATQIAGGEPALPPSVDNNLLATGDLPAPVLPGWSFSDSLKDDDKYRADREVHLLAALQRHHGNQATLVAQLRDNNLQLNLPPAENEQQNQQTQAETVAVLSDAELKRQQLVFDKAYEMLQSLRSRYAETSTAKQARIEIFVMIDHWRSLRKWDHAATLATRFLKDDPQDILLPKIRQEVARDYLAWAAVGVKKNGSKQKMLDTVNERFETAREELKGIVTDFPDQDELRHQAQWDIAGSYLTQARVVASLSSTLARGQYVRSANELLLLSQRYHDHPKISSIPTMLSEIATELAGRDYHDEAISAWNILANNFPLEPLGQQAARQIAQTYQARNQPLQAVEAYVELNFSRGGNDEAMQNAIFEIATQLMSQQRWVEALHALETFVDSFPQHALAGQALTMIGQIHQTNEVWNDAIAAYDRVIVEYDNGQWTQEARWQIAECTINLSRWNDAIDAYRKFAEVYSSDPKAAIANQRIEILKNLERYQRVVDEKGQRKSFDAQFQIGAIVRDQLTNRVKAIIEFRKVATNWPDSHLADDALYEVGAIYLQLGDTEAARKALLIAAEKYPNSPLADDALYMVGKSYEDEARKFAAVTRDSSQKESNDLAQRMAYARSQDNRRDMRARNQELVTNLKQAGKLAEAEQQFATNSYNNGAFDIVNAQVNANWAFQEAEVLSATQLADRQDKINAALRKAVASYSRAAAIVSGDKADDALLRMAQIYDQELKDADMAMETWQEIVKQFSGTAVAEDASWKIAEYYQQHKQFKEAIDAYQAFLRNYRGSSKAGDAGVAIAENYEQLGQWVDAMDAYTNYLNNFPQGPLVGKAKEQISWIKTYRL